MYNVLVHILCNFIWFTDVTFVSESAHLGEEVNITCQIPEEHRVHFCKEIDDHICQRLMITSVKTSAHLQ